MMRKLLLTLVLVALIALYMTSDLPQYLTFEQLKASQQYLLNWQAHAPLQAWVSVFVLYIVVVALSLPGATIMTLAAGALFGLGSGLLLVSFASTIGATLAFLVARYLFKAPLESRFPQRLAAINDGLEKEGAFYLLTLRLVPLFPFFLVNILLGLTRMKTRTYYWISQLGMLPATVVYTNAGTQLAQLQSPQDILSPAMLGSLILLGLFPLLTRRLLQWLRVRRRYQSWRAPSHFDRNLIVIGGGAAGLVSAYLGSALQAKVTLVEAKQMGGDCLNTGCVPSKTLLHYARLARQNRQAHQAGVMTCAPQPDFAAVMHAVNRAITEIAPHDSVERYQSLGVDVVAGHAALQDPWTVKITPNDGHPPYALTSRHILLCTGAEPVTPPIPGLIGNDLPSSDLHNNDFETTETLWQTLSAYSAPPEHVLIIGGGPIACEIGQALSELGSQVSLVQQSERLLMKEDPQASALVAQALRDSGVYLYTHSQVLSCQREGKRRILQIQGADGEQHSLCGDLLLVATGRKPRLHGYGLEALGLISNSSAALMTDAGLHTVLPNILVAGDVSGQAQFTHLAAHQAGYAVLNALFGQWKQLNVDYSLIPRLTFTQPQIAQVGLTQDDAERTGVAYDITHYPLHELDRAITEHDTQGFIKILTAQGKDRILGVTIVGENSESLLATAIMAMRGKHGLNFLLKTLFPYPAYAEGMKAAAGDWKRARLPIRLLPWLARYHAYRRGTRR